MNRVSKPLFWTTCFFVVSAFATEAVTAKLKFRINDANGAAVPCRIHLLDPAGNPVEAPGFPFWKDHFVCTEERLDYEAWWKNLKAGRCFVTNGPLLLVRADGKLPGEAFELTAPKKLTLNIQLISRDHVPQVEILQNGEVVLTLKCSTNREQELSAELPVSRSGWFLARALADNPNTFRFASTAQFYVEVGGVKASISRKSCDFFRKWAEERAAFLREKLTNAAERREVLADHEGAVDFWSQRVRQANAD